MAGDEMSPFSMVLQGKQALAVAVADNSSTTRQVVVKLSYFMLQQVDLFLTIWAVNSGFTEMNPLMRSMLDSPLQLVGIKVLFPMLFAWFCPAKLILPSFVLISGITLWNVKEILVMMF